MAFFLFFNFFQEPHLIISLFQGSCWLLLNFLLHIFLLLNSYFCPLTGTPRKINKIWETTLKLLYSSHQIPVVLNELLSIIHCWRSWFTFIMLLKKKKIKLLGFILQSWLTVPQAAGQMLCSIKKNPFPLKPVEVLSQQLGTEKEAEKKI